MILGMLVVCSFQMAFAATARDAMIVRDTISKELARARSSGENKVADSATLSKVSNTLSRISGSNREVELRSALGRTIQVKEATGTRSVSLLDLANLLVSADQSLRTQNLSGLDAAGKAHLDATQNAIKVSSEFLALANRTSETSAVLTDVQKLEVAAFNKQISLIEEMITKMDTADLKAHTEVMKKAIAKKINPNMNGDQALAAALKEGKTQEDYIQKLNELMNCLR